VNGETSEILRIRDAVDRTLEGAPVFAPKITVFGARPRSIVLELRGRDGVAFTGETRGATAIAERLGAAIRRALGEVSDHYDIAVDWCAS